MVNSIVHTAVARKMLCSPANSLIADTEFACAVGIMLRILKAGEEKKLEAEQTLCAKAVAFFHICKGIIGRI